MTLESPETSAPSTDSNGAAPPEGSLPSITFQDLPPELRDAAARAGWKELMPVQAQAIPYLLEGRDLMVQSRTGSGKTGAFVLPILHRIDRKQASCQALVMVPTRELARQVSREAEILAGDAGVRTAAVYGGVGYGPQLDALRKGAHLVVGTPGRILDHLVRRSFSLDRLKILIFDEADHMLSVGFYPDMKALEVYLPPKSRRDGYMFSATYPPRVLSLAKQFLTDPGMLNLSHGSVHVLETEHIAYEVPAMEKERALVRVIEMVNPDSAIIFCNTKATARFVSVVLQRFGYDADLLSADLNQKQREKVLGKLYRKELRFLVATDVAARGLDITHLSHVFLYEFPENAESYIHRTGRTGRAGASGEAISLVDPLEKMELNAVAKRFEIDLEVRQAPTDEQVQEIVSTRVTALLEAKLRKLDRLVAERMRRMLPLAKRLAENDEELDVMAMLLDQYYQATLHAPPDLPPLDPKAAEEASAPEPREEADDDFRPRRKKRRRRRGR